VNLATNEIDQVVQGHWALAAAGLSDYVWGHASVRTSSGNGILIKSSGWAFEEIDESRIVEVSWDGALINGTGRVHIEVPIHTQIMQARPDVGAVVHCHAPAVTAFASLDQPLRAISHEGAFFADRLPRFELTGDLIRTKELGVALAGVLGEAPALIIPQHGLVATGPDISTAVMNAAYLETACRIQLLAAAAGGPVRWSSAAELATKKLSLVARVKADYRYLVDKGARLHREQL